MLDLYAKVNRFIDNLNEFTIMKAKNIIFLVIVICFASGVNAQIHTGVYTHGSVGRSNTGQTITVDKQLLTVEFYSNYITVNGSEAKYFHEMVLTSATKTVKLPPGRRVKMYQHYVEGFIITYLVDSDYNMEAIWIKKDRNGNVLCNYFFPIEKGNTMSSSSAGGYSSGSYNGGYSSGGYGRRSSSSSSSSSSIPRTRCPNCTNGRRVYESTVGYSGTQTRYSTCSECGKRYMSSHTTHRHDRCTTCHGTGYLD